MTARADVSGLFGRRPARRVIGKPGGMQCTKWERNSTGVKHGRINERRATYRRSGNQAVRAGDDRFLLEGPAQAPAIRLTRAGKRISMCTQRAAIGAARPLCNTSFQGTSTMKMVHADAVEWKQRQKDEKNLASKHAAAVAL